MKGGCYVQIASRLDVAAKVVVLTLSGKFTIGAGDAAIREAIQQSLQERHNRIVLNLERVTTVDSSGLYELTAGFTSVTNKGGDLRLCCLPPKMQDILSVTQLITVFRVFDTEEEAIASFA